jgi:hypothetical protein
MKVSGEVLMLEIVLLLLMLVFRNVIYASENSEIHAKEISYHRVFTFDGYTYFL